MSDCGHNVRHPPAAGRFAWVSRRHRRSGRTSPGPRWAGAPLPPRGCPRRQRARPSSVGRPGTRNHFALDLGLDRADVAAALPPTAMRWSGGSTVASTGDRVFVNNAFDGGVRDSRAVRRVPQRQAGPPPLSHRAHQPLPRPGMTPRGDGEIHVVDEAYRRDLLGWCGALGFEWPPVRQLPAASGSVTRDGGGSPG